MPVWTALGTKSRTRVASVRSGSASRPAAASPSCSSPPPHAPSAKAATASARRAGALELPRELGGIVDREPGDPHVHPLPLERDPLRFEQAARTTRCHGTSGSWHPAITAPAKRGASGHRSPYVVTKPAGTERARRRTSRARAESSTPPVFQPAMRVTVGFQ